eukprot:Opistho-2@20629
MDIVKLNVGGRIFCTSRATLTWVPESFFMSLLCGSIPSFKDADGAYFIDRDPDIFVPILNFLRTRMIPYNVPGLCFRTLRHEAVFYGITPLVERIDASRSLQRPSCGGLVFHCALAPPEGIADESASSDNSRGHVGDGHGGRDVTGDAPPSAAVRILASHHNWLAVGYLKRICLYSFKEASGWGLRFCSDTLGFEIDRLAINIKYGEGGERMVAIANRDRVILWDCGAQTAQSGPRTMATFSLSVAVDALFFIGSHLVAVSHTGRVAAWNSVSQHLQLQELVPITSFDHAGSLLVLGCQNAQLLYVDMGKFPLRMKDNDLLVSSLYTEPTGQSITAVSVYQARSSSQESWTEIAIGTSGGIVRVIVQHPETVGHGPQLFQTYSVHCHPITSVMLSEKHLVSVCNDDHHVRTWRITRFRGRMSTQPGSIPAASFKIGGVGVAPTLADGLVGSVGPFGDRDQPQMFVQKLLPDTHRILVKESATGQRVCLIEAIDESNIIACCVNECDVPSRVGTRPRRFVVTGHANGGVQLWDLTTALELMPKRADSALHEDGEGSVAQEMFELMDY